MPLWCCTFVRCSALAPRMVQFSPINTHVSSSPSSFPSRCTSILLALCASALSGFFTHSRHGIQGLPPRCPQPAPLRGGQRLRRRLPDADATNADATNANTVEQRQVPQERPQARGVRQRGRPRERQGRAAARRAVLQPPRRPRRPRGRRLPLHRHQGQRARHQPRHPCQAQPHCQLLWQEPPQRFHMRLITT
jgi:hypothetical protein